MQNGTNLFMLTPQMNRPMIPARIYPDAFILLTVHSPVGRPGTHQGHVYDRSDLGSGVPSGIANSKIKSTPFKNFTEHDEDGEKIRIY